LAAAQDGELRGQAFEVRLTPLEMMIERLKAVMAEPRTRGLHIDEPATTALRRRIIQEKAFLRRIYEEWYQAIVEEIPQGDGAILELGCGVGFFGRYLPEAITSDVFPWPDVKVVLDGQCLPFADGTLRAVVMTDVFHHISNPRSLLGEAARCVRPGGVLVMVEPWVTSWSRWIYRHLHHEPFEPDAERWEFPPGGPLSGANGALPWIVLERDFAKFRREFPVWQLTKKRLMMPFRYLLSGGVSQRPLTPAFTFRLWRMIETLLEPAMGRLAMFAEIVLERV
jgi:SAM-dependent methyltransferase